MKNSQIKVLIPRETLERARAFLQQQANFMLGVAKNSAPEIHIRLAKEANLAQNLSDELNRHENISFQYQLDPEKFTELDLQIGIEMIALWLYKVGEFDAHQIDVTVQRHLKRACDDIADGGYDLPEERGE